MSLALSVFRVLSSPLLSLPSYLYIPPCRRCQKVSTIDPLAALVNFEAHFTHSNSLYFVGCTIYYKVQAPGRATANLTNFAGTTVHALKRAIKEESMLQFPPDLIRLWVEKPGRGKEDLDELRQAFRKDGSKSFDFSRLVNVYDIDEDNPISVELPGK